MLKIIRCFAVPAFLLAASGANAQDLGPTLQKIKDGAAITVGYREAAIPLSYLDADQKPIGFSLELCGVVIDKIKQKLGLSELKVDYKPVTAATRAELVQSGAVDIECGATPDTAASRQELAFSVATYAPELRWVVKPPRRGRLGALDDLKNKTVVLTQGAPAGRLVIDLSSDRFLGLSIELGKDDADSFKFVESGRAAAFLADDVVIAGLKTAAKTPDAYAFLEDSYPSSPYALAFRKDDAPFKELVDEALIEAVKSGAYEKLYAKWFQSPIPPKNVNLNLAMSEKQKALVKALSEKSATQ